jgi:hypothetical protein
VQILLALSARDADVGEDLEAAAREHWGAICTLYDRFADKRPVGAAGTDAASRHRVLHGWEHTQ